MFVNANLCVFAGSNVRANKNGNFVEQYIIYTAF
jgi:hypothetical protein